MQSVARISPTCGRIERDKGCGYRVAALANDYVTKSSCAANSPIEVEMSRRTWEMDYPSITTILIGLAVMTSLLGIDWFVWGRTYTANLSRRPAQGSQRERHEFKKAA